MWSAVLDWLFDWPFARSDSFVANGAAGPVMAARACTHRTLLQSSERTARHSATVSEWRSDTLLAGSDSFVANGAAGP